MRRALGDVEPRSISGARSSGRFVVTLGARSRTARLARGARLFDDRRRRRRGRATDLPGAVADERRAK
jgi:hypothetical protein